MVKIGVVEEWLPKLLQQESFDFYHSYYRVFRFNHKAHGVIALYRLGAKESFLKEYVKEINKWLPSFEEKPELELPEKDFLKSEKLDEYRGKSQGFFKILNEFKDEYETVYKKDIDAMMKDICKDLLDGMLHSAFHGIIHLAYGYVSNSTQTILEGITTMFQRYSPMYIDEPNHRKRNDLSLFGKGKASLMLTLNLIHENKSLIKAMYNENLKDGKLRKNMHMFGVYGWSGIKYHSDYFMDLTDNLELPLQIDYKKKDMKQIGDLIDWLFGEMTKVFVMSNVINDLFLLHGSTASWSAKQIFMLFDFDTAVIAVRSLIANFLIMYATQGAPELCRKAEDFYDGLVTKVGWEELIQSLHGDQFYEAHVYKIIQCTYEYWLADEKSEYAPYYFAAANIVLNHHYNIHTSNGNFNMKNTDLA